MARGLTLEHPNFHRTPDINGASDGHVEPGVELELLDGGPVNDYWHVRLADGREGFVHTDHVRVIDNSEAPDIKAGIVFGGRRRFHTEASEDSSFESILETGTPLQLLDKPNAYWHVRLLDGRVGFVHSDLIRLAAEVTGGETTPGFDINSASPRFSSAADVDAWFQAKTGKQFIPWFNEVHAGQRAIPGPQATEGFQALCDNLRFLFGQPARLEQLLCLVTVIVKRREAASSLLPRR